MLDPTAEVERTNVCDRGKRRRPCPESEVPFRRLNVDHLRDFNRIIELDAEIPYYWSTRAAASLALGRPGEIEELIACVVADVAVHAQVDGSLPLVSIDETWTGEIALVLVDVFGGELGRQDIHGLRNAFSFQPVGCMLAHRVTEYGRSEADADLVFRTLPQFGYCFRLSVNTAEELRRSCLSGRRPISQITSRLRRASRSRHRLEATRLR